MELKKKHEIKQMKEYLPGFANGFTPGGFSWDRFKTNPREYLQFDDYGTQSSSVQPGTINSTLAISDVSNIDPSTITQSDVAIPKAQDIPITLSNNPVEKTAESTVSKSGGSIVQGALAFAGATANAFGPTKGVNELLADAGQNYAQGDGFGYQRQNDIDAAYERQELSKQNTNNTLNTMGTGAALGASVGSIIPGVGTAIGGVVGAVGGLITGLFGGASRRRRLARKIFAANQQKEATNLFNRTSAHSDYLAQQYSYNHQNTQDDILYGAKKGKDINTILPGFVNGAGVYTNDGIGYGPANSRVAYGETIYNPNKGTANIVKTGRLNQDSNLSYLQPDDIVYGNLVDWRTGKTFRDEALPYAAVLEYLNRK